MSCKATFKTICSCMLQLNHAVILFHLRFACYCFLLFISWLWMPTVYPVIVCKRMKLSSNVSHFIVYVHIFSNIKLLVLTYRDVSSMILVFWMAAVSLPLAAVLILLINDHQQQYCELKRRQVSITFKCVLNILSHFMLFTNSMNIRYSLLSPDIIEVQFREITTRCQYYCVWTYLCHNTSNKPMHCTWKAYYTGFILVSKI